MKLTPGTPLYKQYKDPRYLLIRFVDLNYLKEDTFKNANLILTTQLSNKCSETQFKKSDFDVTLEKTRILDSNPKIRQQTHILKYGGEEFLNLTLEQKSEKEGKDKKEKKQNKEQEGDKSKDEILQDTECSNSGYCRILIPPLIQYPHVCHTIKAQLIRVKNKIEITGQFLAQLVLQIYYRLDFHGSIDIIPLTANLIKNVADVGEMRPIVELTVGQKTWQSLKTSGIHPHWSGHYHAKRQKSELNAKFNVIENVGDNIDLNETLTMEQRNINHNMNIHNKNTYFDIVRFQLQSAGAFLKIRIFSLPSLGSVPSVSGEVEIRMSNQNLFKYPQKQGSNMFIRQDIDLFVKEGDEDMYVGYLSVMVRFNFDLENVINGRKIRRPGSQIQSQRNIMGILGKEISERYIKE